MARKTPPRPDTTLDKGIFTTKCGSGCLKIKTPIIITINGVGINTDLTTLPHHLIHFHKWYVPLDKF